jgi:hypothetical protein
VAELDGKGSGPISLLFTASKPKAIAAFTPPKFIIRDLNPGPPLMIPLEK